jgi:hypothetical protein
MDPFLADIVAFPPVLVDTTLSISATYRTDALDIWRTGDGRGDIKAGPAMATRYERFSGVKSA